MFDQSIRDTLRCPYCNNGKLNSTINFERCDSCHEEFQIIGGGIDLITRNTKAGLRQLVKLNYEDRLDCNISSNNRQHAKEIYEQSGYLDRLVKELNLEKGSLILDAGCGRGQISEYLVRSGYRVLSSDVVPENITDCGNESKVLASIDNLPILSEAFDAIICTDVLEHIYPDTQDAVLKEFFRVLKPGGRLLVSYPGNKIPAHTGHYIIDLVIFILRLFGSSIEYLGRGYGGEAHINMRYPWDVTKAFQQAGFVGKVRPYQDKFLSLPKKLVPIVKLLNTPILRIFFVAQMHGLVMKPNK